MPTDHPAPEGTLTTDARHPQLTDTVEALLTAGQFDAAEGALHHTRAEASAAHRIAIEFGQSLFDLALGRLRRARDAAGRAVEAAQAAQDLTTEISALAVQSLASARIGQPVASLELALLATELAARTPSGQWTLRADIALAHAYLWNANVAMARRTLQRIAERSATDPALAAPAELAELSAWIAYRDWIDQRAWPHPARPELTDDTPTPAAVLPGPSPKCVFPGQQATVDLMARFQLSLRAIKGDVPNAADTTCHEAISRRTSNSPEALPALLDALIGIERGYLSRSTDSIRDHLSTACIAANALESEALGVLARQAAASAMRALNARDVAFEVMLELTQIEQQRLNRDLSERRLAATTLIEARTNAQANRALRAHTLELEKLAYEDSLTGVANKRRFEDSIGEWLAQAHDAGEPFSVALIDLDRFKQINDVFGHEMGDLVLKEVGAVLCANVRERDLAARIGGDEFALLFRGTTDEVARLICDRIEAQVRSRDWANVRTGLRVSLSIGVAEAQSADNPKSFLKRADEDMYQRKRARKHLYGAYRDRDEEAVSPIQIESVARRLQAAETVTILVGSGYAISQNGLARGENFHAWRTADRKRFASAAAFHADPTGFLAHWNGLRTELKQQPVPALFSEVQKLYRTLGCPWIMTERTDEWLQRAGVPAPIELFGSLFKDACGQCGAPLSESANTCPHCRGDAPHRRPAITLLDELPDDMILNEAQLRAKRSDVILVVESDLTLTPTRSLIEKARSRGATIVMLGSGPRASMDLVDECVLGGSEHVARRLAERLARATASAPTVAQLSSDGAAAHAFLAGHGKDHAGRSLQRILEMSDLDYGTAPDLAGWQFPLPRRGRNCPMGPAPTRQDFAILALDEAVLDALRRSFARTLAVLGLEWVEGDVCKAGNWERRFDWWANRSGDQDYRISRMIGSLTLMGLTTEAQALVRFMEQELPNHRYIDVATTLWHWKNALVVDAG